MAKKTYEINEYIVLFENGVEEIRNSITYYNELGMEITKEFYFPNIGIRSGYVEKSSVVADQQDPE
jgi:hypothetical protein